MFYQLFKALWENMDPNLANYYFMYMLDVAQQKTG